MKPATALITTVGHPADRILAIVNKLQQEAIDRETAVRMQTREDVTAELQLKLEEARASITQLLEQARASASEWQQERTRLEEQIAVLNAMSQTGSNNQAEFQLKLEEVRASNAQHLERAKASASEWQQERARFEEQIAVLNARPEPAKNDQPAQGLSAQVAAIVAGEMARVQSLMDEIDGKLTDTSLEMAAEMRLRRERAELEAYLKGLRYSQTKP